MILPDMIKVTVEFELFALNTSLKKDGLVIGARKSGIDFPCMGSDRQKKDVLKHAIAKGFDHLDSLYFTCKVINQDTQTVIFHCEDFMQDEPSKRISITWHTNKETSTGHGFTHYPEDLN